MWQIGCLGYDCFNNPLGYKVFRNHRNREEVAECFYTTIHKNRYTSGEAHRRAVELASKLNEEQNEH